MATPRPLAVGSSTPLEPPWLRRPEAHVGACGCPTLTPYSWEGLGVVSPPPTAPPSRVSEAVPRARKSLRASTVTPYTSSGWAAHAISARG